MKKKHKVKNTIINKTNTTNINRVLHDCLVNKIKWPQPLSKTRPPLDDLKEMNEIMQKITTFQLDLHESEQTSVASLWIVEELIDPISKRFLFNFRGDRSTNRLDKPEWVFAYIQGKSI